MECLLVSERLTHSEVVEVKSRRSYVKEDPSGDRFVRSSVAGSATVI